MFRIMFRLPKDGDVCPAPKFIRQEPIEAFATEQDVDRYLWVNLGRIDGLKYRRKLYRDIT